MNLLRALIERIKTEPVVAIDVVKAFFVVAIAFNFVVTPDQQDAILQLLISLGAVFGIGAAAQRALVTPTSKLDQ